MRNEIVSETSMLIRALTGMVLNRKGTNENFGPRSKSANTPAKAHDWSIARGSLIRQTDKWTDAGHLEMTGNKAITGSKDSSATKTDSTDLCCRGVGKICCRKNRESSCKKPGTESKWSNSLRFKQMQKLIIRRFS